jgi:predicted ATP-binding protein involved in virulence
MRLKKLELTNFRCFESLSIDLDEQLTVLVAKNGQGKTSVLDAIRIGLWAFVGGFDLARNSISYAANNISIDDVQILKVTDGIMERQLPCEITLQGGFDIDLIGDAKSIEKLTWTRFRNSQVTGSKTKRNKNALFVQNLAIATQNQIRSPESHDIDLPVISYYGTGRLWSSKHLTEDKKNKNSKQKKMIKYCHWQLNKSEYINYIDTVKP